MLTPCVIKLVLLGNAGEVISSVTTNWDAHSLMPGTTTALAASVAFPDAPAGACKLAIGLFRNETDPKPTYRMENKDMTDAGFYVLGNITITARLE
jgi:hypothetical protein